MPVYETLVVTKLTEHEKRDGKLEKIVVRSKLVVAPNEQGASLDTIMQAKELGELEGYDVGRLDILVRPF
jgi:hypothetical protein